MGEIEEVNMMGNTRISHGYIHVEEGTKRILYFSRCKLLEHPLMVILVSPLQAIPWVVYDVVMFSVWQRGREKSRRKQQGSRERE